MAAADFPVLGQPLAVRLLERALAEDRLASAYLFAGPDSVGKRRMAEALTAVLLCGKTPACGRCPSCHKLASGTHPDRIEIRLPEDKKEIPVSEIRALQARMPYSAHEGQRRVVLVYDAENLSTAAANALLKTLEEPPARTHFVLTSSAPQSLLPTVRSRCQIVRFAPLSMGDLTTICVRSGASAEVSAVAAALAHGSAAKALAASAQEGLASDRARAEAFDRAASEGSLADAMAAASELAGDKGAGLERAFELLRVLYRDTLLVREGLGEDRLELGDRGESIASHARALPATAILARLAALTEAADRLDKNASPALVAEWVALRFRESRP
jgi:DNA polymerase-3 subunit delta'